MTRQYGLEESPQEYVEVLRVLFTELRRALADDGTLWINLGDSYSIPDQRKVTLGPPPYRWLGAPQIYTASDVDHFEAPVRITHLTGSLNEEEPFSTSPSTPTDPPASRLPQP